MLIPVRLLGWYWKRRVFLTKHQKLYEQKILKITRHLKFVLVMLAVAFQF